MTTELLFEHASKDQAACEFVEHFTGAVQIVIDSYVAEEGLQAPETLTVVLADDFAGEVNRRLSADSNSQDFTIERVGGTVAAKNLDVPGDPTAGVIVVNAALFDFADATDGGQLLGAFTLTHELIHPPLTWTRRASGAMDGVRMPSVTPPEFARSIVRIAADEFRADVVAVSVLRVLTHSDADQLRFAEMREKWYAEQHLATVTSALDTVVLPGWSSTIESCRTGTLDRQQAWGLIVTQTDQMFTLLAHAEASARCAGEPAVLGGPLAAHQAVVKFIGPAWAPVHEFLSTEKLIPDVACFADVERDLLKVGGAAVLRLWESLGLDHEEHADGTLTLFVTEAP